MSDHSAKPFSEYHIALDGDRDIIHNFGIICACYWHRRVGRIGAAFSEDIKLNEPSCLKLQKPVNRVSTACEGSVARDDVQREMRAKSQWSRNGESSE